MERIVAWFSGGVTSAVTCKLCIDKFGKDNVRIVFIDTHNEDKDTYRFMKDCEGWYDKKVETITNKNYNSIEEVWYKYNSLNVAHGAVCSSELKRSAREQFQRNNSFDGQAFGFDIKEKRRAIAMEKNFSSAKPFFPLIENNLSKQNYIKIILNTGINLPRTYYYGFHNNNCFRTGCVQGGIGYWQKMKREFPDKFEYMARIEHELTNRKGKPVTMLRDQAKGRGLLFLKSHPDYPNIKDISMKKGREPKPLKECNGFCGTNDLIERSETEKEINYDGKISQNTNSI